MGSGASLSTIFGWRNQFERMQRWHQRVLDYPSTEATSPEADEYLDFMLAFFLNSFSLRDWLINSGAVTKEELNALFAQNIDLQICRDICNGAKHFEISHPSVDAKPSIVRSVVPDPHFRKYAYPGPLLLLHAGDHVREIRTIATSCAEAWRVFLFKKGLIEAD